MFRLLLADLVKKISVLLKFKGELVLPGYVESLCLVPLSSNSNYYLRCILVSGLHPLLLDFSLVKFWYNDFQVLDI